VISSLDLTAVIGALAALEAAFAGFFAEEAAAEGHETKKESAA
jgi:hypothetical protein